MALVSICHINTRANGKIKDLGLTIQPPTTTAFFFNKKSHEILLNFKGTDKQQDSQLSTGIMQKRHY